MEQVTVVTGGASGIGLATARRLAETGRVVVVDRDPQALESVRDEGFDLQRLDVSVTADWQRLAGHLKQSYGSITGLVHNAGIAPISPLTATSDEDLDRVYATNLRSVLVGTRELWDLLVAGRGGIVVVASVAAVVGQDRSAAYVASKGAAVAVTRALAIELAPHGVRVNSVCPGTTWTPMLERHFGSLPGGDSVAEHSARRIPLGRLLTPEDIAPTIVHLLDATASGAMTGSNVVIDGGLTASFDYGNAFAGGGEE